MSNATPTSIGVDLDRVVEATLGIRFAAGHRVTRLKNGVEIFPEMLAAIRGAERTIDFLTFVYWTGDVAQEFARTLANRAREGLRVRVVLDAFGAAAMKEHLVRMMQEAGVDVRWFRPLMRWKFWESDHRTHRKILIVDDEIGFTGGVGIATEWEGDARGPDEWRETHFRVEGPAVDGLRAAFLVDWLDCGGDIVGPADMFPVPPRPGDVKAAVVSGSAQIGWSNVAVLFLSLITAAQHRIRITTPYFNPGERFVAAMRAAAHRGVDIDVLMPGPHIDKRVSLVAAEDVYEPLLDCGIRIWRYQKTMMHAKILTVDGRIGVSGSANFNARSVAKDEEVCIVFDDPDLVAQLDADFDDDLSDAIAVDGDRWQARGLLQRSKEALIRPIRSEM